MTIASAVQIQTPEVFRPLWDRHARYKGAYGGRGSAKSHDRAQACVLKMLEGKRVVGVRETQKSIRSSVKQLIEDKIKSLGVESQFQITHDEIRSKHGGLMIFNGLRDHTAESIKSLEGFSVCWIEEAQTITDRSWRILTPTMRAPQAEIWATWNPRYEHDPVDVFFRQSTPGDSDIVCVRANWQDNPFFPSSLRQDLERDKRIDLAMYEHVWEGGYQLIGAGAYFAEELARARLEDRITDLPIELGVPVHTGWDIGIDDITAIWAAQIIGRTVQIIDYYEDRNQPASHYAQWCIDHGYHTGHALLPHDAGHREKGTLRTYEDYLRDAGLQRTRIIPVTRNLLADIQGMRGFLRKCWFNEKPTAPGVRALGAYHVEFDEHLQTPKLKPVHDWSSHPTDALRILSKLLEYNLSTVSESYDPDVRINFPSVRRGARGHGRRRASPNYQT